MGLAAAAEVAAAVAAGRGGALAAFGLVAAAWGAAAAVRFEEVAGRATAAGKKGNDTTQINAW